MNKYIAYFCTLTLVLIATYFIASYLNGLRSFEVVVSRYNEDLNWLKTEFPDEKITIYNKGENNIISQPNWNIVQLPNIGRESHTYLYHIISNYNNLADRTLFLQGNPYDHKNELYLPLIRYKTRIFGNISNKCRNIIARCGDSFSSYIKSYYRRDPDRLDDQSSYLKTHPHYIGFREGIENDNLQNFIDKILKRKLPNNTVIGWAMGAQFAVDKEVIMIHNKQYYKNLINIFERSNQEEGYFFEKSWDIIFDNGKYKELN
ncbi:MAG: DUF3431 domain-containing protein [Rickettsiales bacterium]|nr:DUF3431 domain-containing protein [Rickettsiales bacterium]